MPLLEINQLKIDFESGGGLLRAVDGVSLAVDAGETVCLVGESGSGKSVTALSIARLLPTPPARIAGGQILVEGRDTLRMSPRELQSIRGRVVSYVFQEPSASLHPVLRVGRQVLESLQLHRPEKATETEVLRLLSLVGIPDPAARIRDYPAQLSGGMQQRVMLAMALASEPKLLVADEPTTALDVTVQAQILELLKDLQARLGMALLLITHNLGIVGGMADRVAVLYAGQIIEESPAEEFLRQPAHPYSRALLAAVPRLGTESHRLASIPGRVPRPGQFPDGCRFAPRCPAAQPQCSRSEPELAAIGSGRRVRCPIWNSPTIPADALT
ncbi:MAG: ABC transporter ATP-binding protein [Verrucomicrobiota bacterium]